MNAPASARVRYLTFEIDGQLYALRAAEVAEVIRVPMMARVPQCPPALLGIANLRGAVLPVASLRVMLGREPQTPASACVIVLDSGAAMAILVDAVATLESVDAAQIDSGTEMSSEGHGRVLGAFAIPGKQQVARILDIRPLLEAAFASRAQARTRTLPREHLARARGAQQSTASHEMIVTFEVAGQEFALPLMAVQEILPAPSAITSMARSDAAVLGITSIRDRLLPLLSLRTLLGIGANIAVGARQKVIVMKLGDAQVGLVADQARAIIAADTGLVDPVPPVLAARTGGESQIRSVYRGDGGRRLVSILSPEQLFRNEVMQRLNTHTQAAGETATAPAESELIFLVFRLGEDEFGIPIETVVEVAQVPGQITRVPRAPKFLEGVVNLRGEVLPIVDQRRRFDMPVLDAAAARRLVVIRTDRHRAGLIVDSVAEVLRTTASRVEPPPELTEATSRLVNGVLNLEGTRRIVLLLDPTELLTRAEQGLLDTFHASRNKANA